MFHVAGRAFQYQIFTVWSSDCFRTLEFTDLSLSLPFEQFGLPTPFTSNVVDNVLVIDRETLTTVIRSARASVPILGFVHCSISSVRLEVLVADLTAVRTEPTRIPCPIASRFRTRWHSALVAISHLCDPSVQEPSCFSGCRCDCCLSLSHGLLRWAPFEPPHLSGLQTVSRDEVTRQSAAERAIRRRDKSSSDLEVDTAKMLTAVVWLTLLEIRAGTRCCLDIDLVGVPALLSTS